MRSRRGRRLRGEPVSHVAVGICARSCHSPMMPNRESASFYRNRAILSIARVSSPDLGEVLAQHRHSYRTALTVMKPLI